MVTVLDKNKTVWQRLNEELSKLVPQADADLLTTYLHPYVVAERRDVQKNN